MDRMALTKDEVSEDIPTGSRGDRAKLAALTVREVPVWGRLDAVDWRCLVVGEGP